MKDILIFMSDQHMWRCTGYAGDKVVRTPNLDKIAKSGTTFDNAYTSCPLCVPARMSMLSGQLPSKTGVFTNRGSISSEQATFLHSLVIAGYETVLCGRMHFEGIDQRHGFTKRIAGDITPVDIGGNAKTVKERGEYAPTFGEPGCLQVIGGGNSPTLEYDRYVIQSALDYLKEKHDKPQCIIVGTYGPHFPYVAPPELYEYYLDKVVIPESSSPDFIDQHPIYEKRMKDKDEKILRHVRAAYWGMVEFTDDNIGKVYDGWKEFLAQSAREGVFIYLSDHGDHAGDRGYYGKMSFYENSSHIPLIFQGSDIKEGIRINNPVSIMDLGPTLCELAAADAPPEQDGKSLWGQLQNGCEDADRVVISELLDGGYGNEIEFGRMVRYGKWKHITFASFRDHDLLFDLENDPDELNSVINNYPEIADKLRKIAYENIDPEAIVERKKIRDKHYEVLKRCIETRTSVDEERWKPTPVSIEVPVNFIKSEVPLPKFYIKVMSNQKSQ